MMSQMEWAQLQFLRLGNMTTAEQQHSPKFYFQIEFQEHDFNAVL